jgi:hypothetical protein
MLVTSQYMIAAKLNQLPSNIAAHGRLVDTRNSLKGRVML